MASLLVAAAVLLATATEHIHIVGTYSLPKGQTPCRGC
jgi:hypothetical protein